MLRAGDKIDSFTLINELGRGGFGVVWLAEERTIFAAPRVALKIALEDRINLEAIKQEANLWVQASGHINVLPIFGVRVCGEHIVIVSEYVPDGSLEDWLNRHGGKAPSVEAAADMALGVLAGLEHLHAKRIIHRDLKPANILLQGETPRLTDFGLARLLKSNTHSMNAGGTLPYMAPEAFSGGRSVQTDIWAAGVIFYQLLVGGLPFPQQNIRALILAIDAQEPPLPPSVPAPLREVITRALQKDAARRYGSAAEMRKALRAAVRALPPPQADGQGAPAAPERGDAPPTPRPSPNNDRAAEPLMATTLPLLDAPSPSPAPRPEQPAAGRRVSALKSKRLWLAAGVLGALLVVILAAAVTKFSTRPQSAPPTLTPTQAKALDDARLHAQMGVMLKERSEWAQAEIEYRKAVESDADNLDYRLQLAQALGALGRDEESRAEYEEVERRARASLRTEPDSAAGHYYLGVALTNQRKHDEGEIELREAIRLGPGNHEWHRELGTNLYRQSKFEAAEAEGREAIRLNPTHFRAHLRLGLSLTRREKYVEAEAALRESVRLNPRYAFSHNYLGDALAAQKKYAEAEAAYREAIKLFPTWAQSHIGLGLNFSAQKKYQAAEAEHKEAVRAEPNNYWCRYKLGEFLHDRGRYQEAEAAFREAVRLKPDDHDSHNYLGSALYNQKKYAEAEAAYREVVRLNPTEPQWRRNLADSLAMQKKLAEAEAVLKEGVVAAPDDAGYHFHLADFLFDRKRYPEAEAGFREAIRLKPDEALYHNSLGLALDRQKRYQEAADAFREASRLAPNDPLYHNNLGLMLNRLKKPAEAQVAFKEAKRLEKK